MNAVSESIGLGRDAFDVSNEVIHISVEFLLDFGRTFLTRLLRQDVLVPAAEIGRQFLSPLNLHICVATFGVDDALIHLVLSLDSHLLRLHLIVLGRESIYEFLVNIRQMETYVYDFEKLVALAMDAELRIFSAVPELHRVQVC